jgi:YD repeat-containing protein
MVTNYINDTLNRVTDVQYPAQYGLAGNPRKVVHHDYDVSSRLTGLKVDTADYAKDIVYNAASQTTSLKVGANGANQINESYQYDDLTGLLANQKVQRGATSLLDLSYDYLRAGGGSGRTGQLTKILNNLNLNRDRGYDYDALGRLTRATGGQSANWTQDYAYDRYGNRTSVTASGNTASASPPNHSLPTDQLIAFDAGMFAPKSLRADPLRAVSDAMYSLSLSSPSTRTGAAPASKSSMQAGNAAQFVSQTVPSSMTAGQSYSVSVTMRNTGTNAWTSAGAYKLGSQNPENNSTWGLARVELPGLLRRTVRPPLASRSQHPPLLAPTISSGACCAKMWNGLVILPLMFLSVSAPLTLPSSSLKPCPPQ